MNASRIENRTVRIDRIDCSILARSKDGTHFHYEMTEKKAKELADSLLASIKPEKLELGGPNEHVLTVCYRYKSGRNINNELAKLIRRYLHGIAVDFGDDSEYIFFGEE